MSLRVRGADLMGDRKLLVVSIDGVDSELGFTRNRCPVGWRTIVGDLISADYYFSVLQCDYDRKVPVFGFDDGARKEENVAVLKFHASKRYAVLHGYFFMDDGYKYCVSFDDSEISPPSMFTGTNCTADDAETDESLSGGSCYLLSIAEELKLKIMELLDGVDLAKLGCVCSQLRYLTSKEDLLWKRRFFEEFNNWQRKGLVEDQSSWKQMFAKAFKIKMSRSVSFVLPAAVAAAAAAAGVKIKMWPPDYSNFVMEIMWPSHLLNP